MGCCSSDNSVLSRQYPMSIIDSLSSEEWKKYLIDGYCKNNALESTYIPQEIIKIIVTFFSSSYKFDWKDSVHTDTDTFDPQNVLRLPRMKGCTYVWRLLVLNNILSSDELNRFECEFIIGTNKSNDVGIIFGFVPYPLPKSVFKCLEFYIPYGLYDIPEVLSEQCGIYVKGHGGKLYPNGIPDYFQRIINNKKEAFCENGPKRVFKNGDKFKLLFDFQQLSCSLYYNDAFIGNPFTNIPNKLCVTVSTQYESEIICTKWNKLS